MVNAEICKKRRLTSVIILIDMVILIDLEYNLKKELNKSYNFQNR